MKTDDPDLPQSSGSTDGAFGGSLGGASLADLRRGYTDGQAADHQPDMACMCEFCAPRRGGFLDRPQGWER